MAVDPQAFVLILTHPLVVAFHVPVLLMALYHSITWFNLTPHVLVIWRGERRVSSAVVAGAVILAWR